MRTDATYVPLAVDYTGGQHERLYGCRTAGASKSWRRMFVKHQFSRWTGVVVLSANAIAQLLTMSVYPFWSLSISTLDILAICGLIAHGKRIGES